MLQVHCACELNTAANGSDGNITVALYHHAHTVQYRHSPFPHHTLTHALRFRLFRFLLFDPFFLFAHCIFALFCMKCACDHDMHLLCQQHFYNVFPFVALSCVAITIYILPCIIYNSQTKTLKIANKNSTAQFSWCRGVKVIEADVSAENSELWVNNTKKNKKQKQTSI